MGGRSRSAWTAADLIVVMACVAVLLVAATVQQLVVLSFDSASLGVKNFVVPTLVGASFGVLLVRVRQLAANERSLRERLAARERELEELNRGLETKIGQRTRELELAHQQILHAQRLETVGRVAGSVAHDFNNMLTVMLSGLDSIEQCAGGRPEIAAALVELNVACDRARQITRQLLIFSRREAVRAIVVDLRALVDGVHPLLRRLAGESVAVEVAGSPGIHVRCDPGQLEQVVVNLVANARDAGARRIRVTVEPGEGSSSARLAVEDDGAGMPEDVRDRAAEPFFTTKPAGRGTGIGLSVAQGVVRSLGGGLTIESRPGAGTTVRLELPRAAASAEVMRPSGEEAGAPARRLVVLLVEDDDAVRRMLVRMLEEAGHEVVAASSVAAAKGALAAHGPRLSAVVSDYRLADGTGIDVVDDLSRRALPVPALLVTGYVDLADQERLVALPILPKPFTAAQLVARLRELLPPERAPVEHRARS
ncbi:MAG: response regulator [Deltaproteobacteria bacterium]|nr:response regulator [Deltaproteobacteria bacterium]